MKIKNISTKYFSDDNKDKSIEKISDVIPHYHIPEPTKSLLWVTDEDTSKIQSALGITLTFDLNSKTAKIEDKSNIYAEPSLIWTRLPIQPNSELEKSPMYYPSYSQLSSMHRFQYLNWLKDIRKETNLSYVFLYYYGLERHLLMGDYDNAVDEILTLIKHHNKGAFKSYVIPALIAASSFRKRPDIINKANFLLEETSNETLLLRRLAKRPLIAKDVISLAFKVGYSNKRYIKLYPELYELELQKLLDYYQQSHGDILQNIDVNILHKRRYNLFVNPSMSSTVGTTEIPTVLDSEKFCSELRELLSEAHFRVKALKGRSKK